MRAGLFVKSLVAALILPFTLGACASLGGAPEPVVGVTSSVNLAQRYSVDEALRAFHDDPTTSEVATDPADLRRGLTPRQYRDMVVSVYLNAIDSRYFEFRTALSHERRELGTGFDFAILGLTTMASVARDSIVNSLSATASVMTGTRASIDRNFYFDQALPGMLAAMETARLRVLTRITQNLAKTDLEYPLETAFTELRAYEMAASLDGAIGEITATASAQRQAAQTELAGVVQACEAGPGATEAAARLGNYVDRYYPGSADFTPAKEITLLRIAGAMNVTASGDAENYYVAIMDRISAGQGGRCSVSDLENLIARVRNATGEQF